MTSSNIMNIIPNFSIKEDFEELRLHVLKFGAMVQKLTPNEKVLDVCSELVYICTVLDILAETAVQNETNKSILKNYFSLK